MTPDDRIREIERGERWLREVCDDPAGPDIELLKKRVAVEIDEQWLGDRFHDDIPADLTDRVKRRIWATLTADSQQRQSPVFPSDAAWSARRLLRLAGAAGVIAAVLVFAFIGLNRREQAASQLSALAAFEAFSEDDLTLSLAELGDDLAELELAFDTLSTGDQGDELYDELFDELDSILENHEFEDDWS